MLLIGDSLTQFGFSEAGQWVSIVASALAGRCDVINRGLSGYTTKMIRPFLPDIVTPEIVRSNVATVVFLGANDSQNPGELQHVPLHEYKDNLSWICDYLEKEGVAKERILLVPPPPCFDDDWRRCMEDKNQRPLAVSPKAKVVTKQYHDACVQVAVGKGYRHLTHLWTALDHRHMFCDGVHFSAEGAKALAKLMIEQLVNEDPIIKDLPPVCPYWKNICLQEK